MIRLVRELVRALLEASDLYAATVQRLSSLRAPPDTGQPEERQPRESGLTYWSSDEHA